MQSDAAGTTLTPEVLEYFRRSLVQTQRDLLRIEISDASVALAVPHFLSAQAFVGLAQAHIELAQMAVVSALASARKG